MIQALDRAATARATAPAAARATPGSGAEQPAPWRQQGSGSKRGLRGLFACFGF